MYVTVFIPVMELSRVFIKDILTLMFCPFLNNTGCCCCTSPYPRCYVHRPTNLQYP